MKSVCTCRKHDYVYRGLQNEPLTFKLDYLWVCSTCCLPTIATWEGHVRRCEGCLRETCLPWTTLCFTCWKIENPGIKYPGLLNAAKRARKALQWPLPDSLKILQESNPIKNQVHKLQDSI